MPSPQIRFSLCTEKLYTFSADCENSSLASDCAHTHTFLRSDTQTFKWDKTIKMCFCPEGGVFSKDVAAFKNVNVFQSLKLKSCHLLHPEATEGSWMKEGTTSLNNVILV